MGGLSRGVLERLAKRTTPAAGKMLDEGIPLTPYDVGHLLAISAQAVLESRSEYPAGDMEQVVNGFADAINGELPDTPSLQLKLPEVTH